MPDDAEAPLRLHPTFEAATAERIRDKIAASKKKGIWMGGTVPLGYRAENRKLVVQEAEAVLVRRIFARYRALGSVRVLAAEFAAQGTLSPVRVDRHGRATGGKSFTRGKLYALLANPVYIGRIRHRTVVHPGQHAAIVDQDLWQAVQAQLAANRQRSQTRAQAQSPSPLAGKLIDPDGRKMRPSHACKPSGTRYRYYVSAALIEGSVATGAKGWRIPAEELEAALARVIADRLRDPAVASGMIGGDALPAEAAPTLVAGLAAAAAALDEPASREGQRLLRALVASVRLGETELAAEVDLSDLLPPPRESQAITCVTVQASVTLQRRGAELRLVLGENATPARIPDPTLVRLVVEARARLADYLDPARCRGVSDLAQASGLDRADLARMMQLAFLAPDIVERILDGAQPVALTAQRLKRIGELPLDWEEQRRLLA